MTAEARLYAAPYLEVLEMTHKDGNTDIPAHVFEGSKLRGDLGYSLL